MSICLLSKGVLSSLISVDLLLPLQVGLVQLLLMYLQAYLAHDVLLRPMYFCHIVKDLWLM